MPGLAMLLFLVVVLVEGVGSVDLMSYSCMNTTSTFDNVTLHIHNEFRAYHDNTSDLCINQELKDSAETYANTLAELDSQATDISYFQHDPTNMLEGENLCRVNKKMLLHQGAAHCVEKCTNAWYSDEEPLFNYMFKEEQFNPTETVGHFTALVWRETTAVGCAVAQGAHGAYVVCRYYPPGNVLYEYETNIGNKISDEADDDK
ncbi:Golgi-associated plant pathogenesis-related protein 1-like [Bolinopsis microptera]|uniref:Golgi-associated plant pathogenesis-related protein 1-like n=1 Tax=Bolinopsis microptera TaxID=2820187 RepID=UPI00307985B2